MNFYADLWLSCDISLQGLPLEAHRNDSNYNLLRRPCVYTAAAPSLTDTSLAREESPRVCPGSGFHSWTLLLLPKSY